MSEHCSIPLQQRCASIYSDWWNSLCEWILWNVIDFFIFFTILRILWNVLNTLTFLGVQIGVASTFAMYSHIFTMENQYQWCYIIIHSAVLRLDLNRLAECSSIKTSFLHPGLKAVSFVNMEKEIRQFMIVMGGWIKLPEKELFHFMFVLNQP